MPEEGHLSRRNIAGFQVGYVIGKGGMGHVYLGDTSLKAMVENKKKKKYNLDNLVAVLADHTLSGEFPFPLKEIGIEELDLAAIGSKSLRKMAIIDAGLIERINTSMRGLGKEEEEKEEEKAKGKKKKDRVAEVASLPELKDIGFRVAFKSAIRDEDLDSSLPARFRHEVELHYELNHPNLVNEYACGTWTIETPRPEGKAVKEHIDFMAMEYVEPVMYKAPDGTQRKLELDKLHRDEVHIPAKSAFYLTYELLKVLSYLQEHNIVHRDIKPGNIFLTEGTTEGERKSKIIFEIKKDGFEEELPIAIKLGDFGLAKDVYAKRTRVTRTGMVHGTIYYCPREQITDGLEETMGTDVHAAGVALFDLLLGILPYAPDKRKRPNEAQAIGITMNKIQNQTYDASLPSSIDNKIPAEISDLCAIMGLMRWGREFWERLYEKGTPDSYRYREIVNADFAKRLAEGIIERDAFYIIPNLTPEARIRIQKLGAAIDDLDKKISELDKKEDIPKEQKAEEAAKYEMEKYERNKEILGIIPSSTAAVPEPYKPDPKSEELQGHRKSKYAWDAKTALEKATEPIRRKLVGEISEYLTKSLGNIVERIARTMRADAQINEPDEGGELAIQKGEDPDYAFKAQTVRLLEVCLVQRDYWDLSGEIKNMIIKKAGQEFYDELVKRLEGYREKTQLQKYTEIMQILDFETWKDIKIGARKEIGVQETLEGLAEPGADTVPIAGKTPRPSDSQKTYVFPTDTTTDILQFAIFGGVKGKLEEIQPEYSDMLKDLSTAKEAEVSSRLIQRRLDNLMAKVMETKKAFTMVESPKKLGTSAAEYEPVRAQLDALETGVPYLTAIRKMLTAKSTAEGLGYLRTTIADLEEEIKGGEYEALRKSPPGENIDDMHERLKESFKPLYSAHTKVADEKKPLTEGIFNILREYENGNVRILDLKRALAELAEFKGFDVEASLGLARKAVVLSLKTWDERLEKESRDLQGICAEQGLGNSQLPTIITKLAFCYESLAKSCEQFGLEPGTAQGLQQRAEEYRNMLK
ncbi:protein kinase [Candidatus Woesearchaeota archaeon]|nr:protein kinase [Candidatus Woesearchaeota archaeon]